MDKSQLTVTRDGEVFYKGYQIAGVTKAHRQHSWEPDLYYVELMWRADEEHAGPFVYQRRRKVGCRTLGTVVIQRG